MVLAQFGTRDFRGVPEVSADLTRQLLAAGEAGTRMWQLSCTLHWDPNRETNALASGDLWSFGMTLEEFFGEVAALPGWAWALTGSQAPRDLAITLAEVEARDPGSRRRSGTRPRDSGSTATRFDPTSTTQPTSVLTG